MVYGRLVISLAQTELTLAKPPSGPESNNTVQIVDESLNMPATLTSPPPILYPPLMTSLPSIQGDELRGKFIEFGGMSKLGVPFSPISSSCNAPSAPAGP